MCTYMSSLMGAPLNHLDNWLPLYGTLSIYKNQFSEIENGSSKVLHDSKLINVNFYSFFGFVLKFPVI